MQDSQNNILEKYGINSKIINKRNDDETCHRSIPDINEILSKFTEISLQSS